MKKSAISILLLICFLAVGIFCRQTTLAEETPSGTVSDELAIYSDLFKKKKKPPVWFTHKKHAEDHKIACGQCHHVYEDGKNTWKPGDKVMKCEACHNSPRKNHGKVLSLYNAFHGNCRGCHKEIKDKKAPRKCQECHIKGLTQKQLDQRATGEKRGEEPVYPRYITMNPDSHQTNSGEVDNEIIICSHLFKKTKRPPVTFNHLNHASKYNVRCEECHHVYKDGKNIWKEGDRVVKCETCHNEPQRRHGKVMGLYEAYHKNCLACHKNDKAREGLSKCARCHNEGSTPITVMLPNKMYQKLEQLSEKTGKTPDEVMEELIKKCDDCF